MAVGAQVGKRHGAVVGEHAHDEEALERNLPHQRHCPAAVRLERDPARGVAADVVDRQQHPEIQRVVGRVLDGGVDCQRAPLGDRLPRRDGSAIDRDLQVAEANLRSIGVDHQIEFLIIGEASSPAPAQRIEAEIFLGEDGGKRILPHAGDHFVFSRPEDTAAVALRVADINRLPFRISLHDVDALEQRAIAIVDGDREPPLLRAVDGAVDVAGVEQRWRGANSAHADRVVGELNAVAEERRVLDEEANIVDGAEAATGNVKHAGVAPHHPETAL